jgi:hypothetical protein
MKELGGGLLPIAESPEHETFDDDLKGWTIGMSYCPGVTLPPERAAHEDDEDEDEDEEDERGRETGFWSVPRSRSHLSSGSLPPMDSRPQWSIEEPKEDDTIEGDELAAATSTSFKKEFLACDSNVKLFLSLPTPRRKSDVEPLPSPPPRSPTMPDLDLTANIQQKRK